MAPQTNQEHLRARFVGQLSAVLDVFVSRRQGDLADALEDAREFTDRECVMELGWRHQQLLTGLIPNVDRGFNEVLFHGDHFCRILLWIEASYDDVGGLKIECSGQPVQRSESCRRCQ